MSKSRAVGKPAKLAGSGRKLTRVFLHTKSNQFGDNECMKVSKEICYGLQVFHATFGYEDKKQESLFSGFSPHEIRLATDKSEIRTNQVKKEHRARGVLFNPYSHGRSPLLPVSSLVISTKRVSVAQNQHHGEMSNLPKLIPFRNRTVFKTTLDNFGKNKKRTHQSKGKDIPEEKCRFIAKKFILPVRSAHSSRVIKPNKRFRDVDGASCDASSSHPKKLKLSPETKISSSRSGITKRVSGDDDKDDIVGSQHCSLATISSLVEDHEISALPKKIVLRKAKLKVEPNSVLLRGPFSSGTSGLIPQKIVCGVCGAERYYRHLKQARKFGVYSCETCRKFITKIISQKIHQAINCLSGSGNCVIPPYGKCPVTGEVYRNTKCKACWLKMCLQCYSMPDYLITQLTQRLPSFMRNSIQMKPKKKLLDQRIRHNYINKFDRYKIGNKHSDGEVGKKIMLAKSIRKKAEAIARKDYRNNIVLNSSNKRKNIIKTPQHKSTRKIAGICKTGNSESKSRGLNLVGKSSVNLSIKLNKIMKEVVKKEEQLKRLHKINIKGPRVKHVCRSASLVLGQPVATFTDDSLMKKKLQTHAGESDEDNIQFSSNKKSLDAYDGKINENIMEQSINFKEVTEMSSYDLNSAKLKSLAARHLARTLQDLTRQHYDLINGASLEDNSDLVSIDFWESYDPEEVCKYGFALIGFGDLFNIKAVCFLCGSAGWDELIHCSCCCEPFHRYCVESSVNTEDDEWWLVDWVCAQCTLCHTCGQGGGAQISCQRCRKSYHADCLAIDSVTSRRHSADRPWVCLSCLCCKSCNKTEVYKFVGNLPLCRVCFKLRQKGNFCPLCQKCYDDNDFDSKMMECEHCKCWVHAKCEGLSNEKYQILSFLPENVEFICRICCKNPPALWWLAVESEVKAGFLAVLKSLSKNRKVCDFLKWSPMKRSLVCVCSNRHKIKQKSTRFPELTDDLKSSEVQTQFKSNSCKTLTVEGEIEKEFPTNLSPIEGVLCITKNTPVCSEPDRLRNDSQNKIDDMIYQNVDDKPSQYSPCAPSQSDSGIGSADDELKPYDERCFCLGLETWNKTPPILVTVKQKVNSNDYASLDQFNKEMEDIISNIQSSELLNLYYQILKDVFPWFNPKCSEIWDSASRVSHCIDSVNAEKFISDEKPREVEDINITLKGKLNKTGNYYYSLNSLFADKRTCILCKCVGEGKLNKEARLLYCGQNEWVHTNCALWSNEVFEEIDGSLQNVQSAISRSRHIRCSRCDKKGASIGCCNRSCPESYHFSCAQASNCIFFEDKSLFCANHKKDVEASKPIAKEVDFLVSRPVYVELEQKKKKYVSKNSVQIMIGSLTITDLGDCVPELSDQDNAIVPCNYQCSRMYWSSVEPWRLVQYTIKTKIVYTMTDPSIDSDKNVTIDHSVTESSYINNEICKESHLNLSKIEQIKELLDSVLDAVCSKEEDDPQASADLLPPELKEAIFEDLPNNLFNDISMQDIFPKLIINDSSPDVKSGCKSNSFINRNQLVPKKAFHNVESSAQNNLTASSYKIKKKSNSKISLSLKKRTKILNEQIKIVNKYEEKENAKQWLPTKILQIDGTEDCCNDSSLAFSSTANEEFPSPHICKLHEKSSKPPKQNHTYKTLSILQADRVFDACGSSCSSSECSSPVSDLSCSYWKIGQVDGTMDSCNSKDDELMEEDPVKCTECHRTYRTAQSFERHLETCSVDFVLSCSESDSSEEDKPSSSNIRSVVTDCKRQNTFQFKNEIALESIQSEAKHSLLIENSHISSAPIDLMAVARSSAAVNSPLEITDLTSIDSIETSLPTGKIAKFPVLYDQVPEANHCCFDSNTNIQNLPNHSYKPKTIRAMFECSEIETFPTEVCENTSPKRIPPVRTYTRRNKLANMTPIFSSNSKISQYEPLLKPHPSSLSSPALIIQQVPSHKVMPSYIESLPQNSTSNNIQYQYVTTLDLAQNKSQIPLTIQIQPSISVQPVVPTFLGTLIQPNGVEQLVVNTPAPTVEVLRQQPTSLYIANVNQPMYMGMETVVSNTVMSSNQYMSGMLSGSYSSTTTQVFQTAKPVINFPQSYIVVNSTSDPQTVCASHSSQPWSYNYQETYKVKERTTYQQVTSEIVQEPSDVNDIDKMNSTRGFFFKETPTGQEVTVEKTKSIIKSRPSSSLTNIANGLNAIQLKNKLDCQTYSREKLIFCNSITSEWTQHKSQLLQYPQLKQHKESQSSTQSLIKNYSKFGEYVDPSSNSKDDFQSNMIQNDDSKFENETETCVLKKIDKPVISKVKLVPSLKDSSSTSQTLADNNNSVYSFSNDKNNSEIKSEVCSIENNSVCEHYSREESAKRSERKRVPLKENKMIPNKSKKQSASLKKKNSTVNFSDPKLVYEISSQDGISICSQDLSEAWRKIFEAVQSARAAQRLPPLPHNPLESHVKMLGLDNNSVKYLIEQLPGAGSCIKYKPAYHKSKLADHIEQIHENLSGCARSEPYPNTKKKYDMFSWLASRHRQPPKLVVNSDTEIVNGVSRRATSLNLPMAMRFRHLKETSKEAVGVFRSDIHGRGLFCLRDIDCGEMVIEYAGEVIRAGLTDKRENYYTSKGIGCYMFRIDDQFVVDATMRGNAARFINHSCEPNCYSRVVDILGKKHILIFALRKILQGEELTYDYKFPLEDDKLTCHCLSRKCRKFLN